MSGCLGRAGCVSILSGVVRGRRSLRSSGAILYMNRVAPFAGAWIETYRVGDYARLKESPPSRGRGLKLVVGLVVGVLIGRPLRGGVD